MSVLVPGDIGQEMQEHLRFRGRDHPCFLCGKPVGDEQVIMWSGFGVESSNANNVNIFFHPRCVPSFCRRVTQDWEGTEGFRPINKIPHGFDEGEEGKIDVHK